MYCNKLLEEIETKIKRGFNTKILKTENIRTGVYR